MEDNSKCCSTDTRDIAGEWSVHFEKSIESESTRAKVVLSACYLDELLGQLLKVLLGPNQEKKDPLFDGPQAPLSTFSAKIELAGRMGVIPEDTRNSLHYIRKIRNRFAHQITECDFNDDQILDWNKNLHQLNDVASERTRASFSDGPVGDFEKSVSWLVYWLKHLIQDLPTACPNCGSKMEYRSRIRDSKPDGRS